jgi:uncharacterized protein YggU (UPF0235/DUF167 family)
LTVYLNVRAHPNARREEVRLVAPDTVQVWVRASAQDGRANEGIERALSDALSIRRSAVQIIRGAHGRAKVVAIDDAEDTVLERLLRLGRSD